MIAVDELRKNFDYFNVTLGKNLTGSATERCNHIRNAVHETDLYAIGSRERKNLPGLKQ